MTTEQPTIQPYLFFDGRCDEAVDFYCKTLGAEVEMLMRFKDCPENNPGQQGCAPGSGEKVMHMSLRIGNTTVMASDGQCMGSPNFQGFSLSLALPTEAEAKRVFSALSEGGQVQMPLDKTFFAAAFGMVADRFGVPWMIIVPPPQP